MCPWFTCCDKIVMNDSEDVRSSPEAGENPPKKIMKSKPDDDDKVSDFPDSIEGFGYKFNDEGKLRHIETDQPFEFNVNSDHRYNQKRYEALGELINEYVYTLLETEGKLKRLVIPVNSKRDDVKSFIFASEDAMTNPDKLLILIHGSGVVRAGQWARRLIINDCLDSGTQLPYIKRAEQEGYGILVLNTNLNSIGNTSVKGSETPQKHTNYVWKHFVSPAKAKHVAIVAHSFGGVCTIDLIENNKRELQNRVFAIAMTDSVHNLERQGIPHSTSMKWLREVARNWVSNSKPLDEQVISYGRIDIYKVSAGTSHHEMTSWSSFESVFKFLSERYQEVSANPGGSSEETDKNRQEL